MNNNDDVWIITFDFSASTPMPDRQEPLVYEDSISSQDKTHG